MAIWRRGTAEAAGDDDGKATPREAWTLDPEDIDIEADGEYVAAKGAVDTVDGAIARLKAEIDAESGKARAATATPEALVADYLRTGDTEALRVKRIPSPVPALREQLETLTLAKPDLEDKLRAARSHASARRMKEIGPKILALYREELKRLDALGEVIAADNRLFEDLEHADIAPGSAQRWTFAVNAGDISNADSKIAFWRHDLELQISILEGSMK